jgi:multicomponent Na+:H+ antiporter subunit D
MEVAPLAIVVPLLAAALLTALSTRAGRPLAELVALGATGAVVTFCAILLARTASGPEVYWFGGWQPRNGIAVGVSFTVDVFGAGLATLVAVLMVAALVLMWRYRDTAPPHFQTLMLLFLAGMVGFCLSGDLFNMFVFFELMSIAAFALAGYKIDEDEAVEGSLNFAITNTIGSFLILTGIALVYGRTGALNLAQIGTSLASGRADGLVVVAFCLLAAGFFVKAAVVPFHFWLADAYAVAPTPVCLLFAGAMSELGIYGVARIWFDTFAGALGPHVDALRLVLIVAGCVTALVAGVMCVAQDHIKRLLAFATIAYVGVFLIGLGLLTSDGVAGAAIYILADGFGKAALFAAAGIVQHRRRRVSEGRLRGYGPGLPFTGAVWLLGALSFAALPPFGTFFGKALLEDGLVREGYGWAIAVLIVASALTAGAALRAAGGIFLGWGEPGEPTATRVTEAAAEEEGAPGRTPAVMWIPAALLAIAAFAIGVVPGLVEAFEGAAERFMDGSSYAATVIRGAAAPPIHPGASFSAPASAYLYSALSLAGALAVAASGLFGHRIRAPLARRLTRTGARVIAPLRALHSGHVGDYVAWLVAGVAMLGGAFAIALQ